MHGNSNIKCILTVKDCKQNLMSQTYDKVLTYFSGGKKEGKVGLRKCVGENEVF